ncbi:aspartate/glutamate racemase family protein [Priestia koreensis]|uniref:aspartate/glutamate racemase family protein n=1 Tax=Priestia koreensis TaxID=284581 RepID=UPI00203D0846|nr:amino acid racemase [Priestia koreensis]MCM3004147.1 amino acid racemase [Priestia koreensis]
MIGILAGMGPKSTGPFIDKVVAQCEKQYGAKDDLDFPHMMIYSCPTPFYLDRPIIHDELKASIIEGARRLQGCGVDFIGIPCNTAHLYIADIQKNVSVPVINMIQQTIDCIPNSASKVALLATEATVQSGIYQEALVEAGLEYINTDDWQEKVTAIIRHIKIGETMEAGEKWQTLSKLLLHENVEAVIIACTDLNVVTDGSQPPFKIVDSSTCLAKAIVEKYLLNKKERR